jgi:hypothetical protein
MQRYENVPLELRVYPQWVCAGADKIPISPRTGQVASVTDPATWGTFDEATRCGAPHIGFVLTHADPYAIIDLDNKPENPATQEEWAMHQRILTAFESYTERSASGHGYHVVLRGSLLHGRRRGKVEVYSAERYMIFTGDVVRNAPIIEAQSLLDELVAMMPAAIVGVDLEQFDAILSDREIVEMAEGAANGEKYLALARGEWAALGYPSQSEADYAFLSMLAFYTRDNSQVRRLFRASALGKREKAQRDDRYIDTALRKIRSKQPTAVDMQQAQANAQALIANMQPATPAAPVVDIPAPPQQSERVPFGNYTLPPGLVGEIATYIYNTSGRPIPEVSLAAAIAFFAGIAGRAWNISNAGLSQYVILIAETGVGKEDGPRGINRICSAVRERVPMIYDFIGPSAFGSGQGLVRLLDDQPCFLSILSEFGKTYKMMSGPRAPENMQQVRKVLLDLYSKTGWNDVLSGTAYSDKEKNTKRIHAPNVSILGDTTDAFFESITGADIADGFIPRFSLIEYKGKRPPKNPNAYAPVPAALCERVGAVTAMALTMKQNNTCANVQIAADAQRALSRFDQECDAHINATHGAVERQLWNRGDLKTLKIAGLLAVGCNPHAPVVTLEIALWAIEFIRNGTQSLINRFVAGEVGNGELKQRADVLRAIRDYFASDDKTLRGYKCDPMLRNAGMIPYAYLVVRLSRVASFYDDRRGGGAALKAMLDTLVATEVLGKVDEATATQRFKKRQALFYVANGG